MGVVRGEIEVASPLSSPVRERGEMPWEREGRGERERERERESQREREVKVKVEVAEMQMQIEPGEGEDSVDKLEENGPDLMEDGEQQMKAGEKEAELDVEMPLASAPSEEKQTAIATSTPSPSPSTSALQSTAEMAPSQDAGSDIHTRSCPPSPPSPAPVFQVPPRSLSPDDLAPSPFAPPVVPIVLDDVLHAAFNKADIAPGPPVSPDWPLPHAPFPLSSSPSSSPTSPTPPTGFPPSSPASPLSPGTYPAYAASPQSAYPAHTRAVEWAALLERRRKAGEREMAEARAAEERARAFERWRESCGYQPGWGAPPGRGVRVTWVLSAPSDGNAVAGTSASPEPQDVGVGNIPEDVKDADGESEMEVEVEPEQEQEDYVDEDEYGNERTKKRRSRLCIVSRPPSPEPPASGPAFEEAVERERDPLAEPPTDLVYEAPQVLSTYPSPPDSGELGPDPHSRMNTGWGPWKIACRVRVWDVRTRYTPELIRSLVAQEADDYFSARGLPHPDALLFMDEEYYDWELEESASEGEVSGEDEGESFELEQGQGRESFELAHLDQPQQCAESTHCDDADGEIDLGTGMGGVLSSFYVGGNAGSQPLHYSQPPLPLPPPPLASVRVPALRHLFTDIPIAPAEGPARGRGTPVDWTRRAAWGGRGGGEGDGGVGRGTLERRQPQPRPRPHPMYLAMARAAEETAAGYGPIADSGARECGITEEELPPLPRLREPGEPAMLPMRGLKDLVRSMRGGVEEEVTEEERAERERREMREAFEPDEAVWQEFLKSVGVEGAAASGSASGSVGDAMDVDGAAGGDADGDEGDDGEDGGGSGGTSGGVSLGLPPVTSNALSSNPASSTSTSILGAGVGMGRSLRSRASRLPRLLG
ncbi:hypothetical protein B0H15DRAFT_436016 [Mycena belliarum]|uniref:Uncharacterized protein n=1 Tax=Mycena belliarum TaxID=1033014 RepID=A0AAD6TX31_9AGAR|nr:hypothetical protein B0H15DRAFT_436016 [Mycena belliae]